MDESILVSIIVPVYNVQSFLEECLMSLVEQTYKNIEIIIINDGSTDQSPYICDCFAHNYNNITVYHKQNGGASKARNFGLEKAKGKYIYFMDSDDFINNKSIELLVSKAEAHNADIVFFETNMIIETKNDYFTNTFYQRHESFYQPLNGLDMLIELKKNNDFFSSVPLLFLRRDLFNQINPFYEGIIYEDTLFTFLIFINCGLVVHLPELLYNRRVRSESIMTSKQTDKNFISILKIYEETYNLLYRFGDNKKKEKVIKEQLEFLFKTAMDIYWKLDYTNMIKIKTEKKYLFNLALMTFAKDRYKNILILYKFKYRALLKHIILRIKSKL